MLQNTHIEPFYNHYPYIDKSVSADIPSQILENYVEANF